MVTRPLKVYPNTGFKYTGGEGQDTTEENKIRVKLTRKIHIKAQGPKDCQNKTRSKVTKEHPNTKMETWAKNEGRDQQRQQS